MFEADVTQAEDCFRMVEAAVERYGHLDILDNNVGISRRGTVLEVSEEDWDHVMAVNVKSIVLASRYAIPKMIETGGGSIINISSIAGLRAHSSTPYTTSKAAVIGLTMAGKTSVSTVLHPAWFILPWWPPGWMIPSGMFAGMPHPWVPKARRGILLPQPFTLPATMPAGSPG